MSPPFRSLSLSASLPAYFPLSLPSSLPSSLPFSSLLPPFFPLFFPPSIFFYYHPSISLSPTGKAASSGSMPTSIPEHPVPKASDGEKGCESCMTTTANRWYQWGPAHEHCRLCNYCYTYWRKYGGLKVPTKWGEEMRGFGGCSRDGRGIEYPVFTIDKYMYTIDQEIFALKIICI